MAGRLTHDSIVIGHFRAPALVLDFQIFEDGKPQTLSNFISVNIPVQRGQQPLFTSRTIDPDVHTVHITTSLTADAGRVVFRNEEDRSTADLRGKPGGFDIEVVLNGFRHSKRRASQTLPALKR
jgi:hypothetical protein